MESVLQRVSVTDYLAGEEHSPIRHEYLDGLIFAMRGESRAHHVLVGNLLTHVWQARSARSCEVFMHGMKVHVPTDNCFYYPDVVGSCDETDSSDDYLARPCFVIEVASADTAGIDRREKRCHYLTLDSLEEYVIVDERRMHVVVYRGRLQSWIKEVLTAPEDVLNLRSVGVRIALADVYERVKFPSDADPNSFHLPVELPSAKEM